MVDWLKIFIIYSVSIKFFTFLAFAIDKRKSRRNEWRISESTLLFLSLIGGALGAFIAMKLYRHKTQKSKFTIGIPVLLILNLFVDVFLIKQLA